MQELLRTNDLALISVIEAMLKSEEITYFVADQFASAADGSLGFFCRAALWWRRMSSPKRAR